MIHPTEPVAVLVSGGLDSAILVAELAKNVAQVHPLYVRSGLAWETVELDHLNRFLANIAHPNLQPLVVLTLPLDDLYGRHWSLTGQNVPDGQSADEAVYLPGRNLLLLAKALIWCHLHHVKNIALAPLRSNPFPDATDTFFAHLEAAANQAVSGQLKILRPYARLHKKEVLARGRSLPLQWTFSCISPRNNRHCGGCNKCAERKKAFAETGQPDPTTYDNIAPGRS